MEKTRTILFFSTTSILVVLLISIPYILAMRTGQPDHVFGGFLLNPLDGNSYLAKMMQGWQGNWRFRLPFTSDPGGGAFLFLFYIFLGHIARIFNQPLLFVFHFFRVLAALILLFALWQFYSNIFIRPTSKKTAFALASLGAGMGWLLIPFGQLTADFWVAETFPFLSSYTNPHFPLGLALILWLVMPARIESAKWRYDLIPGFTAFILSIVNPFGVGIALMVLVGQFLWGWISKNFSICLLRKILMIGLFGTPVLVYDVWVTYSDPMISGWNQQNLTPSPALWDFLISLSPVLILAIMGLVSLVKTRDNSSGPGKITIVVWTVLGILLVYLPLGLQRRFMMGLFVPLVALAVFGVEFLSLKNLKRYRMLTTSIFLLALPTNIVIILAALSGINRLDPQIYFSQAEMKALVWLRENAKADTLVLASPEMGLYIPAYTGRRVIYGHPFETVNADSEKQAVTQFFSGAFSASEMNALISSRGVDIILWDLREKQTSDFIPLTNWEVIYSNTDVIIYGVGE